MALGTKKKGDAADARLIRQVADGLPDKTSAERFDMQQNIAAALSSIFGDNAKIDVGTAVLTYAAASTATVVVNHDLGVVPLIVGWTPDRSALGILTNDAVGNFSDTQFTAQGTRIDGAAGSGDITIYWWAIGLG